MDQRSPSILFPLLRRSSALHGAVSGTVIATLILLPLRADSPEWWSTPGLFKTGVAADDYAVINQGQLKHLAAAAVVEMNAQLPGGAGSELNSLVAIWADPSISHDDYAAANVGQLKTLAAKFYDQLGQAYPWSGSTNGANDYALANIGQAKTLFSFPIQFNPPQDWFDWLAANGLPDNTPINGPSGEPGLTNWQRYLRDTTGPNLDSDHDGVSDADETLAGTNPLAKDNPSLQLTVRAYAVP